MRPIRRGDPKRLAAHPGDHGQHPGAPAEAEVIGKAQGELLLYEPPAGGEPVEVRLQGESVWLTQKQMSELFATERSVISKHLRNIFASGELGAESNVQRMHIAGSDKPVAFYSLDAIISIGYRVNSKRGTQFRIWATKVLREHLLRGYTVNERRLQELNQAVRLIADIARRRELSGNEATALLHVVADYTYALDLLDDYDHQRVRMQAISARKAKPVSHEEALRLVDQMRSKFGGSGLFGKERSHGLESALGAIFQTFGGKDVYPSLEEKAANLLYFLVKNHPFVDGNKRIGAALFLWFLDKNRALYSPDRTKRIADNALVAMTLLIAESHPQEKDILTRVVVNLINRKNQ